MCIFTEKYQNGDKTIGYSISVDGGFISKNVIYQDSNLIYVSTMQFNSLISVILKYLKYSAVDRTIPMKGSPTTCCLPLLLIWFFTDCPRLYAGLINLMDGEAK